MRFNDVFRNKKVLVTGHTGFKGAWLSLWLYQLGAKVCGISDIVPTSPSLYEEAKVSELLVEDHREDIRNRENILKIMKSFQPDFVFHLAANAIVRSCYDNPLEAFEINAMGTLNIMSCLNQLESSPTTVLITSDKCYENVEWGYGYRETDRLGGKDPYSASKACAEIMFHSFYESYLAPKNFKIATTRAGNVIGGGDWAQARIVPDCVRAWSHGSAALIRSPKATRPWQLVLEPLSGYLRLAQLMTEGADNLSGEALNFGPKANVVQPVLQLIEEMQKVWTAGKYEVDESRVGSKKEAALLKLCCDRAKMRLGWEPILDFGEAIEKTASWYQSFYNNNQNVRGLSLEQITWYETMAKERNSSWST